MEEIINPKRKSKLLHKCTQVESLLDFLPVNPHTKLIKQNIVDTVEDVQEIKEKEEPKPIEPPKSKLEQMTEEELDKLTNEELDELEKEDEELNHGR